MVWQESLFLVKQIYLVSQQFARDEKFGLTFQMRRAAVSIPSNIAEGQARHSTGEIIQFISKAEGSVAKLETQLEIAGELMYCTVAQRSGYYRSLKKFEKSLMGYGGSYRTSDRSSVLANFDIRGYSQFLACHSSPVTCHWCMN